MAKLQDLKKNRVHPAASSLTRTVLHRAPGRDPRIKGRDRTVIQEAVVAPAHQDPTVIRPRLDQTQVPIRKMIAESRKKLLKTELVERLVQKCLSRRNLAGKMSR